MAIASRIPSPLAMIEAFRQGGKHALANVCMQTSVADETARRSPFPPRMSPGDSELSCPRPCLRFSRRGTAQRCYTPSRFRCLAQYFFQTMRGAAREHNFAPQRPWRTRSASTSRGALSCRHAAPGLTRCAQNTVVSARCVLAADRCMLLTKGTSAVLTLIPVRRSFLCPLHDQVVVRQAARRSQQRCDRRHAVSRGADLRHPGEPVVRAALPGCSEGYQDEPRDVAEGGHGRARQGQPSSHLHANSNTSLFACRSSHQHKR